MRTDVIALGVLKPYMKVTYGFNRADVADALLTYEEKTSPVKILISRVPNRGLVLYAGELIKKAKKNKTITTCNGKPKSRYYKFVNQ